MDVIVDFFLFIFYEFILYGFSNRVDGKIDRVKARKPFRIVLRILLVIVLLMGTLGSIGFMIEVLDLK